jgi:anti-sigma-K factor RskA
MDLTLSEIRESGLLELYVLGDLSPSERLDVERAIRAYPELRDDIAGIEQALKHYAFAHSIAPGSNVLDNTLNSLDNTGGSSGSTKSSGGSNFWTGLLGLVCIVFAGLTGYYSYNYQQAQRALAESEAALANCESEKEALRQPVAELEDLRRSENLVVAIEPTERYPDTRILFYNNSAAGRNFLALADLPQLESGQAFQLWALKSGSDPIPLDVFDDSERLIPVSFEPGTASYAITIEQLPGAQSPNLDQLVGVFGIQG